MLINPLIMNVPEPEKNKQNPIQMNTIGELAKTALEKTPLTKGSGLALTVGLAILTFILAYSLIPAIQNNVTFLTPSDIRIAFFVVIIYLLLLGGSFVAPEIIKRFKDTF